MKVLVWTIVPNHYQSSFVAALRGCGIDVRICYYERVPSERISMGWSAQSELPPGEFYVAKRISALETVPDWRERLHVVPGYGDVFLLRLATYLSREGVFWVHWSERSHPGLRWWLTYPI